MMTVEDIGRKWRSKQKLLKLGNTCHLVQHSQFNFTNKDFPSEGIWGARYGPGMSYVRTSLQSSQKVFLLWKWPPQRAVFWSSTYMKDFRPLFFVFSLSVISGFLLTPLFSWLFGLPLHVYFYLWVSLIGFVRKMSEHKLACNKFS